MEPIIPELEKYAMEQLPQLFDHIKIVQSGDKVYKDECICSYDTPESENGLFICMKTFEAIGHDFLDYYYNRYGHKVYLHHKRIKVKVDKPENSSLKPKRLAIGLEGGFDPAAADKDYVTEDIYSIFLMPDKLKISFPKYDLPELVSQSVASINEAKSSEAISETTIGVWDGEQRQPSKYAENLPQLLPAPTIEKDGWKCQRCDLKENLWLNLTDGSILCGRKFFDGSGGNNHALEHYDECKFPLAVKLGTITADGADVYSYPEGDMVIDPLLDKHLKHFGIDVNAMKKTDKSMIELEIDMNEKLGEKFFILEEGKDLAPASGPGLTGINNLGNSCYMNSVLQVLFCFEEFQARYYPPMPIYNCCDGASDFNHQMAKLAYGLLSGKYSTPDPVTKVQKGITPKTFKRFVCANNRDFASSRQQDAHEFLLYLIDLVERNDQDARFIEESKSDEPSSNHLDPNKSIEFVVEDRIQCSESKKVKYTHRVETCLSLHIDIDCSINKEEVLEYKGRVASSDSKDEIEPVRPKIPLMKCLESFSKQEVVKDFYSSAISAHTTAFKSSKISRFPKYFAMQMKKFELISSSNTSRKLDVEIEVPDILDLEFLQGKGLQSGEEELVDSDGSPDQPEATGSGESKSTSQPSVEPNSDAIATLTAMGIDTTQAITALKICNNDAQRAIEYIFDPDSFNAQQPTSEPSTSRLTVATRPNPLKMKVFGSDEKPKLYKLKAFISHMGSSTMCGHYVCHIEKDERWYLFNDNKVAVSEKPPKEFAYIYFFERLVE